MNTHDINSLHCNNLNLLLPVETDQSDF